MSAPEFDFVPATREIEIGAGIVYRPVRSWHSGVYAGERLEIVGSDKSGCLIGRHGSLSTCLPPKSYTHRIYWRRGGDPSKHISAFLSYPGGMVTTDRYVWEMAVRGFADGEIYRFTDETEMEGRIRGLFLGGDHP